MSDEEAPAVKRHDPAVITQAAKLAQKLYLIAHTSTESEYERKTLMCQTLIPLMERTVAPQAAAVTVSEGARRQLTIELMLPEGEDYMATKDLSSLAVMHAMNFLTHSAEGDDQPGAKGEPGGES